ncbi:MAG TPA: DUF503 domain-containing protein [Anaerolineae bacterium]
MIIGICTVQLHREANHSLKDKRSVLKPLLARLHKEFNVAAAEVDDQDDWRSAQIGVAAVGNDRVHVDRVLQQVVHWIETSRLEWQLVDYEIEILP